MSREVYKPLVLRLVLAGIAAVGPTAFPLSQLGYGSLHALSLALILPAAAALVAAWGVLAWRGSSVQAGLLARGALSGALATFALEAVRYPGFRLGFMPGNLPQLMGVLLLDRFALGPSTASNLAGFAYHFWNGASFGIIYALLAGRRSPWWAVPYSITVGLGFLASPVVLALGVGPFGREFGWHFAATVLTAHAAFGLALTALMARAFLGEGRSPILSAPNRGTVLRA
ncbi:MAG TPA: hypothetical protein VGK32_17255 [Vicinamibacterales bacterium]|jgi:hypothetical protein